MAQVELQSRVETPALSANLAPVDFDVELSVTKISAALLVAAELGLEPVEVV